MHLLAVQLLMRVSVASEKCRRKDIVLSFCLLKTKNVRALIRKQALDERSSSTHGVDVPGDDLKRSPHNGSLTFAAAPRQ
jgi:hypothetical protein